MPLKTDIAAANPAAAELRPTLFATASMAPAHQLDLWQSHFGSFNRLNFTPLQGEGFVARNEVWNPGAIALSRDVAPAGGLAREASHIRRDPIDHWVIRIARTGMARYRSPSSNFATRPNVPFLFSLGETFDGDRNGADWLSLYIPRDSFAELTTGLDAVGNALLDMPMARLLGDYLGAFERRLPRMTAADVPALVEATRAGPPSHSPPPGIAELRPEAAKPADRYFALTALSAVRTQRRGCPLYSAMTAARGADDVLRSSQSSRYPSHRRAGRVFRRVNLQPRFPAQLPVFADRRAGAQSVRHRSAVDQKPQPDLASSRIRRTAAPYRIAHRLKRRQ